jgi:AcrR family transcriptional regulator
MRGRNTDSLFFRHLDVEDTGRAAALASQRARMLDAMTRAVAQKGYAGVTVADVVAAAGVSRRTFYEYFTDKEHCFLDAYESGSRAVIEDIAAEVRSSHAVQWTERVRIGLEAYTRVLAAEPDLAQTLLVHVLGAGPRAIALRRKVFDAFAELYRAGPGGDETLAAVPDSFRRGLVGAIGELVQEHILDEGAESLEEITPTLVELAHAVIVAGARGRAEPAAGSAVRR